MDGKAIKSSTSSLVEIELEAVEVTTGLTVVPITDQASYDAAVAERNDAVKWLKGAREWFKPMKDAAHAAHKKICDQEKALLDPVEARLKERNGALVTYTNAQEAIRVAEDSRLRAEALAAAKDAAVENAIQAEANGANAETVAAIMDTPVQVTVPIVAPPTFEKGNGVSYRDNWSGEVTDLLTLIKHIAASPGQLGLVQINQTALNQMAKALKGTMDIPGVRAVNNKVVATGRG